MKQLTSENKVIWILGKIGQFILLNFLVLLGCIPVVTIGASVTEGMYCMSKMHYFLRSEDFHGPCFYG